MKNALAGILTARTLWLVAVAVVWPLWFVLYALTFSLVNEALTRIPSLAADNGMLPVGLEIGLQIVLALLFGFVGMLLVRLARGPRVAWIVAAVLSVLLSLGTVALWVTSETAQRSDGAAQTFLVYAAVGAVMAFGCWLSGAAMGARKERLRAA